MQVDSSLLVSVIIAIVAIIPGVWALINQSKRDRVQTSIDMNKTAQEAALGIIAPLQAEIKRLQDRLEELENDLVEKTKEIGKLMREGIDKDTKIVTLEYQLEQMKIKLATLESKRRTKEKPIETTSNLTEEEIQQILRDNELKKEEIRETTDKTIEQITNGSIAQNKNINLEE